MASYQGKATSGYSEEREASGLDRQRRDPSDPTCDGLQLYPHWFLKSFVFKGGQCSSMNSALDGTPLLLRMNSM